MWLFDTVILVDQCPWWWLSMCNNTSAFPSHWWCFICTYADLFEEILVSVWYILFLHWIFLLHLSTGDFFSCFPIIHGTHASYVF